MVYYSQSEEHTREIGQRLGERLRGGEIVLLSGDLGAGKTAFTKGIARGLGIRDTVLSPTFTLMNEYEGRLRLYHYDAYRLRNGQEAAEAGLCEYFAAEDGVCVIEWWENIADALRKNHAICVHIHKTDEQARTIEIVDQ